MSPVPMMNEASTPTVYLEAQVLKCAEILKKKGKYVPDLVMAGGFVNETQIFKSIAMSNLKGTGPLVKAIAVARSGLTAAFKGRYFTELAKQGKLPKKFADLYGTKPEKFFIAYPELKEQIKKGLPWSAVGVYTYFTDRIGIGLKQLMAGSRKFKLNTLDRGDIASLTERAAEITGIPLIDHFENDTMEQILDF